MKQGAFWLALRDVVGGTPQEVLMKIALGAVTLLVSALRDAGFFIMAFFALIWIDALLGAILSYRSGIKLKPWRFITGPTLKCTVLVLFLVVAAVFDMLVKKTPISHLGESPIVITVSVVGAAAMVWESAAKAQNITGLRIVDWLGNVLDRFKPKK